MKYFMLLACAAALAGCGSEKSGPPSEAPPARPPEPPTITMFYSAPAVVERGESVRLCYGVENAVGVRIIPPVAQLKPWANHCFAVQPERTTEYTLEATGAGGRTVTRSARVRVTPWRVTPRSGTAAAEQAEQGGPPGPRIHEFRLERRDSSSASLCYLVTGAATVSVEPGALTRVHALRGCFLVMPRHTTTYTLIAVAADGKTVRRDLRVTVP